MIIKFLTKPNWVESFKWEDKDPEFNKKKTYFIDSGNYLTRRVIAFKGKGKVPDDIWSSCVNEFKLRDNNIATWYQRRFLTFDKLVISKNLTLDYYQTKAVDLMTLLPRAVLNMDMGTGKTATTIGWWTRFCTKSMLVVCPKNVITEWVDQFQTFLGITPKVISSPLEYERNEDESQIGNVYIINYEKFIRYPVDRKKAIYIQALVYDEVHRGASLTSKTHKLMFEYSLRAERVYGLSGTIVGNHFEDVMGVFALVDPLVYGLDKMSYYRQYTKFILDDYDQPHVFEYINWDKYSNNFHSISYTVKLTDVIDMPDKREEFVYCKKDPNYRTLIQDYIFTAEGINLETGERDTRLFTVDRALNMTAKLMQLCSGFIKDVEGNWIRLNTLKRDSLKDWFDRNYPSIKELKQKVVIFYQFTLSGDDIEEVMNKLGIISKRIDGSVSDKKKELYKKLFKTAEFGDPEGCDVIIINYGTGTEGMNFQRGTIMLYYDQTLEFRKREQAQARIYRRGQTENCLYINFVAEHSKEVSTYKKLSQIADFKQFLDTVKEL